MAPLELKIRVGSSESFQLDIDDGETVEDLAVLVISIRPELGEEALPRLIYKGKILKNEEVLKEHGMQSGDFLVAMSTSPAKAPAAEPPITASVPVVEPAPVAAPATAGYATGPPENLIKELCEMGFDRPKVIQALTAAFNNADRAVEYLFNGIPSSAVEAPPLAPSGTSHWSEATLGPQLLTKSGLQPTQQALGGASIVALYFSAHWCPPCRAFTPQLANALTGNRYPQLAVVFISSDRDESAFNSYYAEMPWLALPYNSMLRQMLGMTFQVRGIPSFIILDGQTGRQISADGRADLMQNAFNVATCLQKWGAPITPAATPTSAALAGSPHWSEATLGPQLLTKSGLQPTQQALGGAAAVALYFSAHWCPPCRAFTPELARVLSGNRYPQLAVVFVSSDRDEASFNSYYAEMPWLALPYNSMLRQMLGVTFQVRGIPSLIVLDGKTGRQVSSDGRGDLMQTGFNIEECLQKWGVNVTTATPAASSSAPAEPPKKAGPPPEPIDEEAVKEALKKVESEPYEVQETFFKTGLKILENTLQSPDEVKFRQLKRSNPALSSKFLAVSGDVGVTLLLLAGFEESADDVLALPGPPTGRCTAVRDRMQSAATAAWEKKARADRDARIKEEMEKDKSRPEVRYSGGDNNGRHKIGRPRGGGG